MGKTDLRVGENVAQGGKSSQSGGKAIWESEKQPKRGKEDLRAKEKASEERRGKAIQLREKQPK